MDPTLPVEPCKLFVGGISWDTNEAKLREYFSHFGEVSDCKIMKDQMKEAQQGKGHRGFGFVTFANVTSVNAVLQGGPHVLDNKKIDPKPATIKTATHSTQATPAPLESTKKCFLGGLAAGTKEEDLIAYFSQIGKVTEVDLKYDKDTERMRGFGFVAFETEQDAEKALVTNFHQIKGKSVEIKRAQPRHATAGAQAMRQQQQQMGGGGGGYAYQQQTYPQADYSRSTNTQQQYQQQQYYPGYNYANYAAGQYANSTAAAYSYDSSAAAAAGYPRTQTTSGDRQDTGSSYYQGGHNVQQMASYGQDGTSYGAARTYNGGHEVYGQQSASYAQGGSQQQQQQQQQQRGYSRGGGGAYGH